MRNPFNMTSYLSLTKFGLAALAGLVLLKSSNINAITVTLVSVGALYLSCLTQQMHDKSSIRHVFKYFKEKAFVGKDANERLFKLSVELVSFATNQRNRTATVHAGIKEVLSAVNEEKNRRLKDFKAVSSIEMIAVAESAFDKWVIRELTSEGLQGSTTHKGK